LELVRLLDSFITRQSFLGTNFWCFLNPSFFVVFLLLFLFALLYSLFPLKEGRYRRRLSHVHSLTPSHKTDPANQHTPRSPDPKHSESAAQQQQQQQHHAISSVLLSLGRKFDEIDRQPRER
jgi:hypothetical protein